MEYDIGIYHWSDDAQTYVLLFDVTTDSGKSRFYSLTFDDLIDIEVVNISFSISLESEHTKKKKTAHGHRNEHSSVLHRQPTLSNDISWLE